MATLLLRLAGPLQSWGIDSKYDTRGTGREPSKSGVIGLLAAALGLRRDQDEEIGALASGLRFGVRVEQEGTLLRDFHTAHKGNKPPYVTQRYYLSDAVFLVGLESGDEDLLSMLEEALNAPAFPLFLGRRSCPPVPPMSLGIREGDLLTVLREAPWQASDWAKRKAEKAENSTQLRLVTDGELREPGSGIQRDLPVSFNPAYRNFSDRAVVHRGFMTPPGEKEAETRHDPMAELGGDA